jgi:polysaccharide deacetylase family protein (PEP-CTERM system associated)
MFENRQKFTHCLTVDLEDYFHVSAFRTAAPQVNWDYLPSRIERNSGLVLDLLEELGVKGTFFVVGWVAEKYPRIVQRVTQAGHELGCHSYSHELIYKLDRSAFRRDTIKALGSIEQATGQRVTSYRAPSFSITRVSLWALDILVELGITHDSSIFPVRHDIYGIPNAPKEPFAMKIAGEQLIEFPASCLSVLGTGLPITGGGYLRILPLLYQQKALSWIEKCEHPGMIYFHPWELDPEQPRIQAPLRSRLRHYTGLSRTAFRIRKLCASFRFAPMNTALPERVPVFELTGNGGFRRCSGEFAATSNAPLRTLQERARACV